MRRAQAADLASRQAATTILTPETVAGKVSPGKVLMTTLGGQARVITADVLRQFRDRIAEVGKNLRVGIMPREALAMSRPIDVKRARDEIKGAVAVMLRGSVLRMATEPGPASKVVRHIFEVEFPQFKVAVARPGTAQQAAAWLLSETPIRFNCDCQAHTFWLRYIGSIGGFSYGRQETGFPKIRNPQLSGCLWPRQDRVIRRWKGCSVTNCRTADLLVPGYIKPWSRFSSRAERLGVGQWHQCEPFAPLDRARRSTLAQRRSCRDDGRARIVGDVHRRAAVFAPHVPRQGRHPGRRGALRLHGLRVSPCRAAAPPDADPVCSAVASPGIVPLKW